MAIQNIDMAVPVGRDPVVHGTNSQVEAELASEAAELESLVSAVMQAIVKRQRTAWSAKELPARRHQFEVEVKGLVKRFATSVASVIGDKDGRAAMRVRLYSDLMTMMLSISADAASRQARKKMITQWLWGTAGVLLLSSVALNLVLLSPWLNVWRIGSPASGF